ncbi:chaperonin GroEL [Candidatus Parcubacteria bacterium]|nr:chaperonin GroEL [Candidatus Parcubacteria bacterium]
MITLLYGKQARDCIEKGMQKLHKAVATSMGPAGRNFFFEERDNVRLTKDGASIARYIYSSGLLDPFEQIGAAILRRASQKTEEEAGDGTTAATVLAYAMALAAKDEVNKGANVMGLERGMRFAFGKIEEYLKKIAKEAKTPDMWERVAYISSRDPEIAGVLKEACTAVTPTGWIRVDKGDDWKDHSLELKLKKGMTFDRGFIHDSSINDPKGQRSILKDCPVFVTDEALFDERQGTLLASMINAIIQGGERNLCIVAHSVRGRVLDLVVQCNTMFTQSMKSPDGQQGIRILAIEAPGDGSEFTEEFCDDIAILTGAKMISSKKGRSLDRVELKDLGRAEIIETSRTETTIVNDDPKNKDAIELRVEEIKARGEKADGELEKKRMERRLASLTGGSALIVVGGRHVENIGEKTQRVEDAYLAIKAANEEGVVPGAGMALVLASREVKFDRPLDEDEAAGCAIVWDALHAPMRTIASNCCMDADATIAQTERCTEEETLNMHTGKAVIVNAMEDGVVDPLKVVRLSLLNAIETALAFITTETVGVQIPEDRLSRPIFEVLAGDAREIAERGLASSKTRHDPHPNEIDS